MPEQETPEQGPELIPAETSAATYPVTGRIVLIAGATSESGMIVASSLDAAGARVIAVGSNEERLAQLTSRVPEALTYECDLADPTAVMKLAESVHSDVGRIDGLIHLVGGWRGGGGLDGQSDEDWDALSTSILTTLRNTSRTFFDDLVRSASGRLAIVSATAVDNPTASNANYAAAKSAAETWVRAVADGFRLAQSGAKNKPRPQHAAAVSFVIKALLTPKMREEAGEKTFSGYTDVQVLAEEVLALWAADAAALNGKRIRLDR